MSLDARPMIAQARLAVLAAGRDATAHELAAELGVSRRSLQRWSAGHPIGAGQADRCACRLNLHPLNLWPNYYGVTP